MRVDCGRTTQPFYMEPTTSTPESYLLNFFRQSFAPAANFKEATDYLSTEQIYAQMAQHTGNLPFDIPYLHQWLIDNGYTFERIDGMDMVWLLAQHS